MVNLNQNIGFEFNVNKLPLIDGLCYEKSDNTLIILHEGEKAIELLFMFTNEWFSINSIERLHLSSLYDHKIINKLFFSIFHQVPLPMLVNSYRPKSPTLSKELKYELERQLRTFKGYKDFKGFGELNTIDEIDFHHSNAWRLLRNTFREIELVASDKKWKEYYTACNKITSHWVLKRLSFCEIFECKCTDKNGNNISFEQGRLHSDGFLIHSCKTNYKCSPNFKKAI